MASFRKRAPKVVWLTNDPINSLDTITSINTLFLDLTGAVPIGGQVNTDIPIVNDAPFSTAASSLSDANNSGYRLRRIVGKIWVGANQVVQDDAGSVIVTAGFIIRRVTPAGAPSLISGDREPAGLGQVQDPWIWRRQWLLANAASTNAEATYRTSMPFNNLETPSSYDGNHVDQKTARIVGPEERLFLAVSSTALNANTTGTFRVRMTWDLRVLASMRSNTGNRRNASR